MLYHAKLPLKLWAEASVYTMHVHNCFPMAGLNGLRGGSVREMAWTEQTPSLLGSALFSCHFLHGNPPSFQRQI